MYPVALQLAPAKTLTGSASIGIGASCPFWMGIAFAGSVGIDALFVSSHWMTCKSYGCVVLHRAALCYLSLCVVLHGAA